MDTTGSDEHGGEIIPQAATVVTADMTAGAKRIADEINQHHRLAQAAKTQAVEHAIECGRLLLEQKERLKHGGFMEWIAANVELPYSTAALYMKAARENSNWVAISSLRGLFPRAPSVKRPDAADIVDKPTSTRQSEPPVTLMSGAPSHGAPDRGALLRRASRLLQHSSKAGLLQTLSTHRDAVAAARKELERTEARLRRTEDEVLEAARKLKALRAEGCT